MDNTLKLLICFWIIISSCTTTKKIDDFSSIKKAHKTFAILPAVASFKLDSLKGQLINIEKNKTFSPFIRLLRHI